MNISECNLSRTEKAYYSAAKSISLLSDYQHKLGAVVVKNHHIINSGHNSKTSCHPIQVDLDRQFFKGVDSRGPVHAESSALIPLIKRRTDLSGATLYIYREKHDGSLGMARPCERCMQLIQMCGIRRIKYTSDDGFVYEKLL